jgi:hypothetical protein
VGLKKTVSKEQALGVPIAILKQAAIVAEMNSIDLDVALAIHDRPGKIGLPSN